MAKNEKNENWSKNFRCNSCQYVATITSKDLFCVRERTYEGDFKQIMTFKCPKCFKNNTVNFSDVPHKIKITLPPEHEWERTQKGIKISCGALIFYNNKLLICRPRWDSEHWNLPKGIKGDNESPLVSAIREIYEETNIKINPNCKVISHGKFPYKKKKDLFLFTIILDQEPKELKCNSFFTKDGKEIPEMVDFKWIDIENRNQYFSENLNRSVNLVLGENNGNKDKNNTV